MSGEQYILKPYLRAGVPLVALETADAAATLAQVVRESVNGTARAVLVWDCVRGLRGANEGGKDLASVLNEGNDGAVMTARPDVCIQKLSMMPEKAVAVLWNVHAFFDAPDMRAVIIQGLWNLRDTLKAVGACVVLTVPLGFKLPAGIASDCISGVVPLPGEAEHIASVKALCGEAGVAMPDDATLARAGEALNGLSAFAAEQSTALSLSKSGLDLGGLWERKRRAIEQTRGLSVWRGGDNFAGLGGLENAKGLFRRLISGKRRPRVVVWIDEIEKAFAGSSGDTSGVSQAFLGATLSEMENSAYTGAILYGHPGTGKSAIAKAVSGEIGCPCIGFDVGALKGSLVGESEGAIRAAWQVVKAVGGQGGALVLATANALENLPAELLARFRLGTLFFDLPTSEEQAGIWKVWRERFAISPDDALPDCAGWVGREIASCCDMADRLSCTIKEAAQYVVPVCKSSPDVIERRRVGASGRYLSASSPGIYRFEKSAAAVGHRVQVGE